MWGKGFDVPCQAVFVPYFYGKRHENPLYILRCVGGNACR